jgi:hypothetical protein
LHREEAVRTTQSPTRLLVALTLTLLPHHFLPATHRREDAFVTEPVKVRDAGRDLARELSHHAPEGEFFASTLIALCPQDVPRAADPLAKRAVRTMLARSTHFAAFAAIVRDCRDRPLRWRPGAAEL